MSHSYVEKTVNIVSSTNATPIVVTATAHGASNGDVVDISGHDVNLAANGSWVAAGVTANTLQLTSSVPVPTGGAGGGASGTLTVFKSAVTLPDDAVDQRSAASVNNPFGILTDRVTQLRNDYLSRQNTAPGGAIYPVYGGQQVYRMQNAGLAAASDWISNGSSGAWISIKAAGVLMIPMDLPDGCEWTEMNVSMTEKSAAAAMNILAVKVVFTTGVASACAGFAGGASVVDPAPSITNHVQLVSGSEVIDAINNKYFIQVTSSASANGDLIFGTRARYKVAKMFVGAI